MTQDPDATSSFPTEAEAADDAPRPRLALFVDPDVAAASRLAEAVRDLWSVEVVATAADALAALRLQVPALLVTELDLPDANGLRLLATVRGDPTTAGTLLLVVTARTATDAKIAAFDAGADDVLVKPVDPSAFRMHVQMVTRFRQIVEQ